jgi:hypothetical protein
VVMPQVMQGLPRNVIHPQGGMPNWRCVPRPRASGVIQAANASTTMQHKATAPERTRPPVERREPVLVLPA